MIFPFLIATFVMSDILLAVYVYSTKIGENSDISKCFENFVSQALGVLTRIYDAELRYPLFTGNTGTFIQFFLFQVVTVTGNYNLNDFYPNIQRKILQLILLSLIP